MTGATQASALSVEPGQSFDEIPTPAVLVNLERMERNLSRYQSEIARHGVALRPHAKAHKVPQIAIRQLELGAVGLATAKASEAEVFLAAGCRDLVVAYPLVGKDKWTRVTEMAREAKVSVNVESETGARGLSAAATASDVTIGAQIEVDTGLERCGFPVSDTVGIEKLAHTILTLPGLELEGITSYRGRSFAGAETATNDEAGRAEGTMMVELAERLRERGLPIEHVTAGSTATSPAVAAVPGITEVRAGAYVFYDGAQLAFGSASFDDVALTVLCTIVSTQRRGFAAIDAGSKTFSASGPSPGTEPGGFGVNTDRRAIVTRLNEEHGVIRLDGDTVEVGQRMQFIPYHASAVVGLADELIGLRDGRVSEIWPVRARGRRT